MAYSLQLIYNGLLSVTETAGAGTAPNASAVSNAMSFNGVDLTTRLNSSNTPEPFYVIDISLVSGGTDTIDLTACHPARNIADTIDLTNKKIMAFILSAPLTPNNVAGIIVKAGASNGYPIFGAATDRITIFPGEHRQGCIIAGGTLHTHVVDGTHKTIDITGTALDQLSGLLIFG